MRKVGGRNNDTHESIDRALIIERMSISFALVDLMVTSTLADAFLAPPMQIV